jgi:drug/metabolite transporter (DMT)-like permease
MEAGSAISASDWAKGIVLSILASIVGGVSKLAIRKSWLLQYDNQTITQQNRPRRGRMTCYDSANQNHHNHNRLLSDERFATISSTTIEANSHTGNDNNVSQPLQEDLLVAVRRHIEHGDAFVRFSRFCCCLHRIDHQDDVSMESVSTWFPYCLRYAGMLGMSVLNPICCVLAMNYASPSILAPFSGLTLCWVILGSPCVNNEKPSSQQILACALIIAGEVVVAIFGDHTNDDGVTVEDVRKSYLEPVFVLYFVMLLAYMLVLGYWMKYSTSPVLRRFAWGSCGGSLTGPQNFLKDSLTILKDTAKHQQPLPWIFYLFIVGAAGTAFGGLLFLTACMKRYDATYSAASFVGSFVVSASIMASAHYNTFGELEGVANYVLYPTGLVMLMIGVYILVRKSSGDAEEGDGDGGNGDDNNKLESEVSIVPKVRVFPNFRALPNLISISRTSLITFKWSKILREEKTRWCDTGEYQAFCDDITYTSYESLVHLHTNPTL